MSELDAARIETVKRHMALEITHDWDGVIATFDHPRYELLGPGTVFDGEAAVRSYFAASREPFPDQANEIIAIAADAATDTVLVEFWLTGTHLGPLALGVLGDVPRLDGPDAAQVVLIGLGARVVAGGHGKPVGQHVGKAQCHDHEGREPRPRHPGDDGEGGDRPVDGPVDEVAQDAPSGRRVNPRGLQI